MAAVAVAAVAPERVPRSLVVQWHVTERCNLRCRHCYQGETPTPELAWPQMLDIVEQIRALIQHWGRREPGRLRRVHLNLTGGEPFVREDLLALIEHLRADAIPFTHAILSNGTLVDAPLARRLKHLGTQFVQVSIEGGRATHDAIRGPGSHEATVAALRRLRQAGVATMIAFTAHRGNYREFGEVARLGARLGVQRVWADRLIPVGRGAGDDTGVLSVAQTQELFEAMHAARRRCSRGWWRTEVAMHRALQFLVGGGRPYHCAAGDSLLTILPNGDLLPCRRLPLPVGNLTETPLPELYDHSPLLQSLRDPQRAPEGCRACAHAAGCRGGLRCLAHAVHGDASAADPGCPLAGVAAAPA